MVAQRKFAAMNPTAFHRDPMTIDDYMDSRYISAPLRLFDCDYPIDASGAVIFATEERARDFRQKPVFVEAAALGSTDRMSFEHASDMVTSAPHAACKAMWSQTSLRPEDVAVAGLYDGFSFITMNWIEAMGFCGRGEAADFVREGNTSPGGRLPVNTDGGMVNIGRIHGVNHLVEVVRHLRGQAGDRQIDGARVGVAANAVGPTAVCMLVSSD
jgi:acetyl-CoA acetyltransferase